MRLSSLSVCPSHILKVETPLPATHCRPSLRPGIRIWRIFSSLCRTHELVTLELFAFLQLSTTPGLLLANSFQRRLISTATRRPNLSCKPGGYAKIKATWVTQSLSTPIPSKREPPPSRSQRLIGPLYTLSASDSLHEPTHREPKKRLAQPGPYRKKYRLYLRFARAGAGSATKTTSSAQKVSSPTRRTRRCHPSSLQLVRHCAASLMSFTTRGHRAPSSSDIQNGRGRGPSFRRKRWLAAGAAFL